MTTVRGKAGADIKRGQMLMQGEDGMLIPASPKYRLNGAAIEDIKQGQVIEHNGDYYWRPVQTPNP